MIKRIGCNTLWFNEWDNFSVKLHYKMFLSKWNVFNNLYFVRKTLQKFLLNEKKNSWDQFPVSFISRRVDWTQRAHLGWRGWPDSNPGRLGEVFQNRVAMSRWTNWPPKLSTYMVVASCMFNIHGCIIHFCVRSKILVNMIHNTSMYVEHT